jgi:8-oxo-dGTP pyrophosphatase MutT (NUDIX family)
MAYYTEEDLRRLAEVSTEPCSCCEGTGEHLDGHECYTCDASGLASAQAERVNAGQVVCEGHHGRPDDGPENAKERYGPDFEHYAALRAFGSSESPFKEPMDRFFEKWGDQSEVTHAGIAVVARDTGRVLMQQRSWDEEDAEDVRGTWEFPGGGLENGEDPQEGAWREFHEETGLPHPEGEVVNGWRSANGVYQGFVFAVPVEQEAFPELNPDLDAADTINPDDPERVNPDVTAWFTVEQAQGLGAALRPEVRDQMDWSLLSLEAPMDTAPDVAARTQLNLRLAGFRKHLAEDVAPTGTARTWFGVLAPEGVKSGDKRMFSHGSLRMRSLPLPLTWQKIAGAGHDGNITVAIIQEVWRSAGLIWGAGEWLDTPEADECYALVEKFGRYGVSIDADDLDEFAIEVTEDGVTVFTDARQCSACIVSIPAFAEAFVMNGNHADFARDFAGGWGAPSQQIPTRENEGQDECEERDEDGNCIEREPDAERKTAASFSPDEKNDPPLGKRGPMEDVLPGEHEVDEDEGEPCDPENDPDCVADEEHLPEKEMPFAEECDDCVKDIPFEQWNGTPVPHEPLAGLTAAAATSEHEGFLAEMEASMTQPIEAVHKGVLPLIVRMKDLAPGLTEDGPGWLTHPVDTDRLRDYWVRGPGAAKIGWGTPDDFYRCEAAVAEYVKPQYLKGYCANRHFDALGYWPGQAPHKGEAIAMTASAQHADVLVNGVRIGTEPTPAPAGPWSLTAAAPKAPADLPLAWFQDPHLPCVTPLTVTKEGHVFGHLATWGQCHIGFDGECVMLPKSRADYSYYRSGVVETDGGEVFTGALTIGGGHANGRLGWRAAMEHYDNTCSVIADLAVGEDEFGVWFSGALRQGVTDAQIRELKAAGKASGDWREVVRGSRQLELVAALAVNVGGFPVPRMQISASGGRIVSLTAAGVVEKDPVDELVEEVAVRLEQRAEAKVAAESLRAKVVAPRLASLRDRVREE